MELNYKFQLPVKILFVSTGMLESTAGPCRRHAIQSIQMTVLDIIIVVLHWPMCVRDFVQLLLRIQSMLVSNARVKRAFVHYII